MTFNIFYIITFTIFLVLIPQCSCVTPEPSTSHLIDEICSQTPDQNMCTNTLIQFLYAPNTDIKGLCQISVTQALEGASKTEVFVQKSEAGEKDKTTKDLYQICQSGYQNLINGLVEANLSFGKGDYRSMVWSIEKLDRFVSDCENVLGKNVPALSSLNWRNKVLVSMSLVTGKRVMGGSMA